MRKLSYRDQLLHPKWQRKRLEVMDLAGFKCALCGDGDTTLNVHHRRYVSGRMAWEYDTSEMECLCRPCHQRHHDARGILERLIDHSEMSGGVAIGLIGGHLDAGLGLDHEAAAECKSVCGESILYGAVSCMMTPRGSVGWPEIADAISRLFPGDLLNPSERNYLAAMKGWLE